MCKFLHGENTCGRMGPSEIRRREASPANLCTALLSSSEGAQILEGMTYNLLSQAQRMHILCQRASRPVQFKCHLSQLQCADGICAHCEYCCDNESQFQMRVSNLAVMCSCPASHQMAGLKSRGHTAVVQSTLFCTYRVCHRRIVE